MRRRPPFLLGTIGALIVAAWLLLFEEVAPAAGVDLRASSDDARGVAEIVTSPVVWGVSLILLCRAAAFELAEPFWTITLLREGALGSIVLVPALAAALVTVAAAAWSDHLLRRTRSLSHARPPFIFLGFLALAIFSFAQTRAHQSALAVALLNGAALGAVRLADIVAVDLAPHALAGRFLGFIASLEVVAAFYVMPIVSTLAVGDEATKAVLTMASGVIGAGLTLLLLRRLMRPAAHQCVDRAAI